MTLLSSTPFYTISHWLLSSITNHNSLKAYLEPLIQWVLPHYRADLCRSHVVDVRHENEDVYSLIIKPGRKWQGFMAGQHIALTIEKNGAWVSRYFSISSSPAYFKRTGLIELSIRIQPQGRITPWLPTVLNTNNVVNLSQASGDFILPAHHQQVCFIAGGSGITPFRAMLEQLALSNDHSNTAITLLYYARGEQHFLFKEAFQSFAQQHTRFELKLINTRDSGVFCADHVKALNTNTHFYICGPSPMITHVRDVLSDINVDNKHIHYEFFGPEPLAITHKTNNTTDTPVLFTQSHKQVQTDSSSMTLLELAERNQINAVSGCRIGVCHQCLCQKKSGITYNTKTHTYSDTGTQEIQLCINVAVSNVVLDL